MYAIRSYYEIQPLESGSGEVIQPIPPSTTNGKKNGARKTETPTGSVDPGPQPSVTQGPAADQWVLPDLPTLLDPADVVSLEDNGEKDRAALIEETLLSFGAPVKIV